MRGNGGPAATIASTMAHCWRTMSGLEGETNNTACASRSALGNEGGWSKSPSTTSTPRCSNSRIFPAVLSIALTGAFKHSK